MGKYESFKFNAEAPSRGDAERKGYKLIYYTIYRPSTTPLRLFGSAPLR
jgi:hypothetical protein